MGASPPLRLVARPAYHSYWGGGARTGAAPIADRDVVRIDLTGGTATGRSIAGASAVRLVPCTLGARYG
jgi:acyl-CoA reductase-like NAD-dependent aldehyde dehydrogenase